MAASPTLRRRRLARQLFRLREDSGMTAKQAAAKAKSISPDRPWFEAKVTRIETRKLQRVRDVDVQTLLDVYEVTDPEQREAYRRLARDASRTGWWVGYRDVLGSGTYVDLETEASRIRTYQTLYIPGLLQTEAYAQALIHGGSITDDRDVEHTVEARMMRQGILHRAEAPRLWTVIDEAAFDKIPSGVAETQLRHLIDVQRPTLRVQVLPHNVGPHAGMDGAFVVLDFASDPSTVYVEHSASSLFVEDPAEVEHYEMVYDHVHAMALSPADSRAWMERRLETVVK
ncbi:helix-turn-helix transcriptional regulator [Streptomonospora sediminis]